VWVKKHKPDVYDKFEVSEFEQSLAEMGNEVEALARGMFPGGYLVERRSEGAQELTKKLVSEHKDVIFQAVFATDKFLAATDVLKWNDEAKKYDIYEIKMSSTEKAEVEDEEDGKPRKVDRKVETRYEYDLAFQTNVVEMCGVPLNKKYLVRLNKAYIKNGDLDFTPNKLFIIEDKTEAVDCLRELALGEMERAYEYLSNPTQPTGPCPCYYKGRSAHCTAFSYINPTVPAYSVHDINRIGSSKKYLMELLDAGIMEIGDVPEDERLFPKEPDKNGKVSKPKKLNQVRVHKSQEPLIDIEAIKKELNSFVYPLYFLDYETYTTAIPIYDGYHPYQHIVFQYSLHVVHDKNSAPIHYECLVLGKDPSIDIVKSLRENIGDIGTVISWYKNFENSRNRDLAKLLPEFKDFLLGVVSRTYDLMDIVENQHYVHPGFHGKSSIKKVLPVIAKLMDREEELSYKKLGVQNGTGAIEAYRQLSAGELIGDAAEEKKRQMLEYCKLDTYGMYIICKYFSDLIS
jgi:hypothetical protein